MTSMIRELFTIAKVDDYEQFGNKLWSLTAETFGFSISIDAKGRRPEPGDSMELTFYDRTRGFVARTVVIPKVTS